ncbi:MAG TPA: HAMP domain-containing sensor histidine kinase [Clostridia bacterium]|nr:HAMP domain-containing sensor histidine kinase [Clostridia bacterium]
MIWLLIAACITAAVFGIRLFQIKRQLNHIKVQLDERTAGKTEKKITVSLIDGNLIELAAAINRSLITQKELRTEVWRKDRQLKDSIANLSHDLRTPLTSILGYLQLFRDPDCPSEKRNDYLRIIDDKAHVLKTLINDLYELSVLDTRELNKEDLDLNLLLSDVLAGQYELFHKSGIVLNVKLPDSPVWTSGDRVACIRILQNLLNNTIRYAQKSAEIVLEKKESHAFLSICNSSPNLTQEDVEHLFDRFYTADKSRTGGGTGLGLSIVKDLLLQMGGTVEATYRNNNLCLTIQLPVLTETQIGKGANPDSGQPC